MTEYQMIAITSGEVTAQVSTLGAELVRLQDAQGRDYLWDGNPDVWKGRAPLLFPMVGRAFEDRIIVDGQSYLLLQHGFARTSTFEVETVADDCCVMVLRANDETLARYPFRFRLNVEYRVAGHTFSIVATVRNEGDRAMPTSFGFHPAFRWPLPGAASRADHTIVFDQPEPAPIRQLDGGLILPEPVPTPVDGRHLALRDDLFRHDALIFDRLVSRGVDYCSPNSAKIRVIFPDMPYLGIWTKPGAGFVCIEPWHGLAAPTGYAGEFAARPGVVSIAPGAARQFAMAAELAAP